MPTAICEESVMIMAVVDKPARIVTAKWLTIAAADGLGMPVSTTHVLNSAVAGTMVANKSGLNFATVKTILSAWIFTLPATICLSGGLYWLFLQFVS